MIRMNRSLILSAMTSALVASLGATTTLAADSAVKCPSNPSSAYATAKSAAEAGYSNLAFFALDRVIRASANKADTSEFVAAVTCMDEVQAKDSLVDLPNYDAEISLANARAKTPEAKAALAHFAFRTALQRIATGAKSSVAIEMLRPVLKTSAFYESAVSGLLAEATGNYAVAKTALAKANSLASDAPTRLRAELKLAQARALYASGEDAAALAQYESLYKIGAPMQDALIESSWAHLRSKNYVKSIGLSYELSTGKLAQFFAPEASSIRAIGFVENCRYAESRNAIAHFASEYNPLAEWLKMASKSEHSLYETALARSEGAVGAETVPEKVWSMWSTSDLFVALQSGIKSAFSEERDAADWIADQKDAKTKAELTADLKKIALLRSRGANRIEMHLAQLDASMASRIARESERMRFVRVEASQGAGRDLVYRNANPGLSDVEKKVAKEDRNAKSYSGKLAWGKVKAEDPSAEMWIDEIGGYEAATLDRCKAKTEYKKLHASN
jgi:hypothetical protein